MRGHNRPGSWAAEGRIARCWFWWAGFGRAHNGKLDIYNYSTRQRAPIFSYIFFLFILLHAIGAHLLVSSGGGVGVSWQEQLYIVTATRMRAAVMVATVYTGTAARMRAAVMVATATPCEAVARPLPIRAQSAG